MYFVRLRFHVSLEKNSYGDVIINDEGRHMLTHNRHSLPFEPWVDWLISVYCHIGNISDIKCVEQRKSATPALTRHIRLQCYPPRTRDSHTGATFSKASARERTPTQQYLWRHFLLFSRRTFAGVRFAERSTVVKDLSMELSLPVFTT